ncbi:alanine racemase 1 [Clostridia bacterium]|nr:alanine racemase 1 [Clostridia bacterium]
MDNVNFIKRTWAEININALEHNYKVIRNHVQPHSKICCVVKADGYGHGAVEVAKTFDTLGTDWFAVSNIEEALQLRQNGINKPLLILGYTPPNLSALLSKNNISQAVYSLDYAEEISEDAVKHGVNIKIHLKIDTGMSRIGLMYQDFDRDEASINEAKKICSLKNIIPEGVFTHFAVSDEADEGKDFTKCQFERFVHAVNLLESAGVNFEIRHCANSGGVIDYPEMHLDMVRAGIILYGLAPSAKLKGKLNLIPAMELKSVVSQVKKIEQGTTVSYGRAFTADSTKQIATIPTGYADGYTRDLAGKASVQIFGQRAAVVGRVCMDQLMSDVTNIKNVKRGDIITLFGSGTDGAPTADDIAAWSNTINYEVTCLIGKRVARVYLQNGKIVATSTLR